MLKIHKQGHLTPGVITWHKDDMSYEDTKTLLKKVFTVFPHFLYESETRSIYFSDVENDIEPLSEEQEQKVFKFFTHVILNVLKKELWCTNFTFGQDTVVVHN